MKKLLIMMGVMSPILLHGEGTMLFANYLSKNSVNQMPGLNAPILVYSTGLGAEGDHYLAELFFAPVETPGVSISQSSFDAGGVGWVSSQYTGTNVWRVFNSATAGLGLLKGAQIVFDPKADTGTQVGVQLRAWSASLGTDFDTAWAHWQADPSTVMGASPVMTVTLGNRLVPVQPSLGSDPDPAYALRSSSPGLSDDGTPAFTMYPSQLSLETTAMSEVPEPSVLALAGLGLAGVIVFRRRK